MTMVLIILPVMEDHEGRVVISISNLRTVVVIISGIHT